MFGEQFHEQDVRGAPVENDCRFDALVEGGNAGFEFRDHAAGGDAGVDRLRVHVKQNILYYMQNEVMRLMISRGFGLQTDMPLPRAKRAQGASA